MDHCPVPAQHLFEKAAQGFSAFSAKKIKQEASRPSRGPRGETLAHWFAWLGAHGPLLRWIEAGGPALRDDSGALPIHWMAARGVAGRSGRTWILAKGSRKIRGWIEPQLGEVDGLGRDALGLMCSRFGWRGAESVLRAFPERACFGARMGGDPMSVGDLLVAIGWSLRAPDGCADNPLARALERKGAMPSLELPPALRHGRGLWTEELWDLGLQAAAPPALRAAMEASHIEEGLEAPKSGPAPRL